MIEIKPTARSDVTAVKCPNCGNRLPNVGLFKDSFISGLTFRCPKCKNFFSVRAGPVSARMKHSTEF